MALDPTNLLQPPQPQQDALTNPYPPGYVTPDQIKAMNEYSQALLKNSMGGVPGTKGGWTVGLQHLVEALMGGKLQYQSNQNELASRRYDAGNLPTAPGAPMAQPDSTNSDNAPSAKKDVPPGGALQYSPSGDVTDKAAPITKNMEGGKYDQVVTTLNKNGMPQRALGAYGIMDFNVPSWSREVLGKEMTPEEFLKDRAAQDAIYKAKMGSYIAKYGPENAGRVWLGGEGGIDHPERADAFGTTVGDYGKRFASAFAPTGDPSMPAAPAQQAITKQMQMAAALKGAYLKEVRKWVGAREASRLGAGGGRG